MDSEVSSLYGAQETVAYNYKTVVVSREDLWEIKPSTKNLGESDRNRKIFTSTYFTSAHHPRKLGWHLVVM